jgi:hypothetical protein
MRQLRIKDTPKGEYIKKAANSQVVFVRGDYDREIKRYACADTEDFNREVYIKGDALVWVGFTY